jgi:putative Holliday junction resolvase
MAQSMALDFGIKRTGIAVTDDMKLIASGLKTVETKELMAYLKDYFQLHKVDEVIIGQPKHVDGKLMNLERNILFFIDDFKTLFPNIKVHRIDERFTSKIASKHISKYQTKKKQKQQKGLIDEVSATLLLQDFLNTSF